MALEERLKELKIVLPDVVPIGNYLPAIRVGNLLYISGQLPKVEGRIPYRGRVGQEVSLESARLAAKACIANLLAVTQQELGSLDRVKRVIRISGYVRSYPGFEEHAKVMNAASDLLVEIFGEAGRHSRIAVGVVDLPLGAAIEVDGILEVK